ncbi:aspartyl-phosphate phosphatase Spo0E family protein [Roseburia sp. 1XD42-34]
MERLRKKMYEIYKNDPNDSQILIVSQELDALLNELDRVENKENK